MSEACWSYLDGERQQQGPCAKADLLKLVAEGMIGANTFVWRPGMSDWMVFRDVAELNASGPPPIPASGQAPAANILTQRLTNRQPGPAHVPAATRTGAPGFLIVVVATLAIGGFIWANSVYHFLPGSGGPDKSEYSDRWFREDNKEGVILQCKFERTGKCRYRITALVSAGVARGRRLPVDRQGSSQVVIRASDGREVLNTSVSNAKLCPS